jgi:hypothetical protein
MVELVGVMGGADCEGLRSGFLAQPANAVSSLAFAAVGLWLLWRGRPAGARRLTRLAGAGAFLAVGLGSAAYHGPQPDWGGLAHDGAIAWLVMVLLSRALGVLRRPGVARGALAELVASWTPAALWMVPAAVAYGAGRTGSPLCDPASLWQAHAAWHVLSAVGLGRAVATVSASTGRSAPRPGRWTLPVRPPRPGV